MENTAWVVLSRFSFEIVVCEDKAGGKGERGLKNTPTVRVNGWVRKKGNKMPIKQTPGIAGVEGQPLDSQRGSDTFNRVTVISSNR